MSLVVNVQTISVIVASISVVASAIYYVLNSRFQSRIRQTDSLIRLSPWFGLTAREIQETIRLVCSVEYASTDEYFAKYSDKPEHLALKILGNYLEGIGILVHRKLIEADLIYDFWGDIALSTWESNEEILYAMRERSGEPKMFEYWEYLSKDIRKRKDAEKK
jgi:hypothetical protein